MTPQRPEPAALHELQRALADAEARAARAHQMAEEAIRAQHALEAQLRQSQKMETVGQLAGGIAHDFNNLLTVIRGHSELLATAIDDADPRHEGIRQIHDASRRATALTRQLLAFTRQQVLQPRLLSINHAVATLVPMLQRLIGEDITVDIQLSEEDANVMADPAQLDQVLINLAVNARDAMPNGGTLAIATSNVDMDAQYVAHHQSAVAGPYVLLAVSDTGVGMDALTKSRAFEPFFTTKAPGQGCGLGLSTVYGIVKQSGGYTWVYSELGQGTTFKIYLPRALKAGEAEQRPATPIANAPGGHETVLVVEDDNALRSLSRQMLARKGYTVLDAANGREALHLATHHEGPIDLVITDMVMPEMGGRILVEQLLAIRPALRVLFMSGYTDGEIVRRGMLEAQAAFIQKPFAAAGFLRAVRDVLDRPRPTAAATPSSTH